MVLMIGGTQSRWSWRKDGYQFMIENHSTFKKESIIPGERQDSSEKNVVFLKSSLECHYYLPLDHIKFSRVIREIL